jgi:hypothetical protein
LNIYAEICRSATGSYAASKGDIAAGTAIKSEKARDITLRACLTSIKALGLRKGLVAILKTGLQGNPYGPCIRGFFAGYRKKMRPNSEIIEIVNRLLKKQAVCV